MNHLPLFVAKVTRMNKIDKVVKEHKRDNEARKKTSIYMYKYI